jgi:hypothetical protein
VQVKGSRTLASQKINVKTQMNVERFKVSATGKDSRDISVFSKSVETTELVTAQRMGATTAMVKYTCCSIGDPLAAQNPRSWQLCKFLNLRATKNRECAALKLVFCGPQTAPASRAAGIDLPASVRQE